VTSAGGPRTLAERYRLDEVIGRGGMSTVYRGTDLALDRVVAVKVALDPLVEQSPIYLARFTREAKAAAAIDNPGVVTVYDAGADGPTRFIVMEYVEGYSLAEILREEHPLDADRAVRIAEQVAGALSAAHVAGIIHRDVKPGNIMVAPDRSVKVLDFGIARALDGDTLTQTATVLGTSAYMSPEQALGQPVDARSDIYSLGCVLYEMLTGEPPFVADSAPALLHQHVRVKPKPARERNPAIPPALDDLVMQMLAKAPNDRPQTGAEVRDRLAQAESELEDGNDALTTIVMAAATAPAPATAPVEAPEPAEESESREEAQLPKEAEPLAAAVPLAPRPEIRPETRPPTRAPTRASENRVRTTAPSPPPSPARRSATGFWITVFVVAAVLLGGAVAVALTGGGAGASSTTGHSSPSDTGSHTSAQTTVSQPPQTHQSTSSTTAPPQSTSSSTSSSTTTSTSSAIPTTTVPANTTGGTAPPGHGGTPPGQAKKGKY
jgi:serine/threonine-protein kinase